MEECEVEVIEPQDYSEKEQAVFANIIPIRVPVQQMIINGKEQVIYDKACAIACPKCRAVIQQFQPGVTNIDVYKAICTDDEELLNQTIYCSKCGHKLKLYRPMPVEVETYDVQKDNV